jgi:glucan phosphoethanolaminetransferase (alkaline phosphatase superfamily)
MSSDLVRRASMSIAVHLGAAALSAVLIEAVLRVLKSPGEAPLAAAPAATLFGLTLSATLAASLVTLLVRSAPSLGRWAQSLVALLLLAGCGFGLHWVVQSALSGAWIKQQSWAPWLGRGAAPLLALVSVTLLLLYLAWRPRRRWVQVTRATLMLLLGLCVAWLNASQLPGQYANVHRTLIVLSSLLCVLSLSEALAEAAERGLLTRLQALATALALSLGIAAFLRYALRPSDAVTSALLLGSERAAYMLPLVAKSQPGTEIYAQLANLDMTRSTSLAPTRSAEWTLPENTNVVLIVVDTLRADTLPPTRDERKKPRFSKADAPFLASLVEQSYRFQRAYAAGTMTRISMPSLFRSRHSFEESTSGGEPLAVRMSELGLYPFAVVGQHFIEPTDERMAGLLEGFAEIEVYPESRQDLENPMIRQLLERVRERPFFAWLHYYATHYEGFVGHRLPSSPSDWPANYPRTVRWVDKQLRDLMETLDQLDLTRRTLVVFTSDHGEGLMDTGQMWHGDSLLDEAVRVPLSFLIPGRPGGLIPTTVGNIDIVPTIVDLLGKQSQEPLRGRSLVPLFEDPQRRWDESYYIEAEADRRVAVVQGGQKHIFDRATRLHMHFDLDQDPGEDANVFDALRASHRRTLGRLVELRPELFGEGMSDAKTQSLLDQRLREIDPANPPDGLDFLLALVQLAPSETRLLRMEQLFLGVADEHVAAKIVEHLYDEDPKRFRRLLARALDEASQAHTLSRWIDALSQVDLTTAARSVVRPYLSKAAKEPRQSARPWFTLVAKGSFSKPEEVSALRSMLIRVTRAGIYDAVALRLGLIAVSQSKVRAPDEVALLTDLVLPLLNDPHPNVEAAACRALGTLGDTRAIEPLKHRLYGRPFVVRLGAMHALAPLLGPVLEPELLKIGREPGYTLNTVVLLERIGTRQALSFLEWVTTHGERPFTKKRARQAMQAIERRSAKAN